MDDYDRALADIAAIRAALSQQGIDVAVIKSKLADLEHDIENLAKETREGYVPIPRYAPLERLAWAVGILIVTAIVGAVLNLVVNQGP